MATNESQTIHLDPDSELARALASLNGGAIFLDSNGVRFRVIHVEKDAWADYDPDAVLEALQEVAGSVSAGEGERMKELIYRARDEGTRSLDRP